MKRTRFTLLGILIVSLLANLPAANWISGQASTAASPFFAPSDAPIFGSIFQDGFESGDTSAWSVSDPGTLVNRKSPSGLGQGEKFTGLDSLPPSGQFNAVHDEGDDKIIGISNLGGLFEIDCNTSDSTFMDSIPSEFTNPLDPVNPANKVGFSIDRSTGLMGFSNTEVGNKIVSMNIFTGETSVSQNDLAFPQGDPNEGKTPKINGLLFADGFESGNIFGIDSNNDALTRINRNTGETTTIGSLGVDISCMSEIDSAPKNDPAESDKAFMSAVLEGEQFSRFYSVNLQTGQATEIGQIGDGTEKIQSFTLVRPVQDSAATCDISPSSDKVQTGTQYTFTVTVFLNGQPVSGANVGINITSGPNQGVTGTANTGQNGQATFAYMSNNQSGTDVIQASGVVDGNPFSCSATVEWSLLLIQSATHHSGKKGQNITLIGVFRRNDGVEVNDETPNKVKYKKCDGNDNCMKIVVKNGVSLLNPCPGTTPVTNEVRVFRPQTPPLPPIVDTTAFATCP